MFSTQCQCLGSSKPDIGLIYMYFIGQQGKPYVKAFDLRLEAAQYNIYYITIYNISAQTQLQ